MRQLVRYVLVGAAAVLLQWLLVGRLQFLDAYPDLVLLVVAWIALVGGRLSGSIAGFATGLVLDVIYGTWGIQMFAKTLVGFMVGIFASPERAAIIMVPQRALATAFVTALLHNCILAILVALGSGARTAGLVMVLCIGNSIYTALLGLILALFGGGGRADLQW